MAITDREFPFFIGSSAQARPLVAISACLGGDNVRYDGRSKPLSTGAALLARQLDLTKVCPEVGAGMTVPRPPIQLVQTDQIIAVRGRHDPSLDMTERLDHFRRQSLQSLSHQLCGYIVKSRSPSCGLESTPIFNQQGQTLGTGSGVQAAYFRQQLPWLPMVEETALQTEPQCRLFIQHCRIVFDLRNGCRQWGQHAVRQHYQAINALLTAQQQSLCELFLSAEQTNGEQ